MTDRKSGHRSSVEAGTVPPPAPETAPGVASLCLIVPTLNERDNIDPLLVQLEAALAGIEWEIIFVDDDSRDGTTEHIQALARRDRRVRCLHRTARSFHRLYRRHPRLDRALCRGDGRRSAT
jgi:cellulose synthase/poly-beta-1,6-N-acetylglucosamine synthase-like glycosyltransferase